MKKIDKEKLRQVTEWLGAALLTTELPNDIAIPRAMAVEIVGILSALPEGKEKRPKLWSAETEIYAVFRMLDGVSVPNLAREIAEETGQPQSSAERRLWALRRTQRFTNWKVK